MERAKSVLKERTYVSISKWRMRRLSKDGSIIQTSAGDEKRERRTILLVFC